MDELPPVSNLHKFTDMGADLVIFSGGKDIQGPQGSGLILGRKDLIKACAVNGSPNYGIGRPMKVDKEEIVGLVKALELYVAQDFRAEMKTWERQRGYLVEKLSRLAHVNVSPHEPVTPGSPGSFYLPAAYVELDEERLGMTRDEVVRKLREGDPGIVVDESPTGIVVRVHMLEEGQEKEVTARLIAILCK